MGTLPATLATPLDAAAPTRLRRRHLLVTAAATAVMYGAGAAFAAQQAAGQTGIWAPLSDLAVLGFAASLVPVVVASAADLKSAGAPTTRLLRTTGLVGVGLVMAGSVWLLARDAGIIAVGGLVGGAALMLQFLGLAGVGVWLAHTGVLTLGWTRRGRVAGWSAVAAGVGYVAGTVVAALQLFGHPLFLAAYGVTVVGFATWLVSMIRKTR